MALLEITKCSLEEAEKSLAFLKPLYKKVNYSRDYENWLLLGEKDAFLIDDINSIPLADKHFYDFSRELDELHFLADKIVEEEKFDS